MKILLIQPNVITFGGITSPPLALLFVGTVLKRQGHDVRIIDRNIDFFAYRVMREFQPEMVGITSITGAMLLDAVALSQNLKRVWGDRVVVVWGGIHTTLLPEQTLRNDYVDAVVLGDGEETMAELAAALAARTPLHAVRGIGFKDHGRSVFTEPRPRLHDLDQLPPLDWSLVNYREYFRTEITLVTSRGCPHSCAFCYNEQYSQRQWRAWSAARTLEEIRRAVALTRNRNLKFYDDNFGADRQRLLAILAHLDKDFTLWLELRVDALTAEVIAALAAFRRVWLFIGVESGSDRVLRRMDKNLSTAMIRERFALLQPYRNIEVTGSVVIGTPGETDEEMRQSVAFLKQLDPTRYSFCIFFPFPGSRFYRETLANGHFREPATTAAWAQLMTDTVMARSVSHLDPHTEKEIRKIYRWGYRRTISNYIRRGQLGKFAQKLLDYRPFLIKLFDRYDVWRFCR